ncbi:MAG: TetR/AcrR family transcriptional regulator [Alphaproteobacteria bacterium]
MARTQSENYPEIRREILRKAAVQFARKGYPNTTIADLAEANGISRGLLYHYFGSKEAMLHEMLDTHLDHMLAEVEAAAKIGNSAESRFRNVVRAMVAVNAGSKDLQIVLLHDLQNLQAAQRDEIVAKQRAILAVLRRLIRDNDDVGRTRGRALKAYTMMVVGMINYTYLWYDPTGPVGPRAYADMVADACLGDLHRTE